MTGNNISEAGRQNLEQCYAVIQKHYGERKARRSGQRYMSHIDEGLTALKILGASWHTMGAWCLHPVVQSNAELLAVLKNGCLRDTPVESVILAMEYRQWANAHLSFHAPKPPEFGPCLEVKQMLIVDKIQNRKDFEKYLFAPGAIKNKDRLIEYFKEWFDALSITNEQYLAIKDSMDQPSEGRKENDRKSRTKVGA